MFLRNLPQLPAVPSMRLNIARTRSKTSASASASLADSATPSPTQSTHETCTSAGGATSVSDPDDYADTLAAKPVSSATMRSKSNTTTTNTTTPASADRRSSRGRRASSRVRKPTAKAQALGGTKRYSPPPSGTIIIGRLSPEPTPSSSKEPLSKSPAPKETPEKAQPPPKVLQTPSAANVNGTQTPSPTKVAGREVPVSAVETPSRRTSQRERKPTAKVLSETVVSQKRPATDEAQDAPARKSARLSHSAARVPSKLRYSISAENSEVDDVVEVEQAPEPDDTSTEKSKIVVLKSKRLAEVFGPPPKPKPKPKPKLESSSPASKRKSKRRSQRLIANPEEPVAEPGPDPLEIPGSCDLTCLSPSSRLLAFAEIALQMPDGEDENEKTVPGSVYDWRMYTQVWCQCEKDEDANSDRTDSVELARALMPNPVSSGTIFDPIDLTSPNPLEPELLSAPVNTILRATDAERLSQLYTPPSHNSSQTPNGTPAPSGMGTRNDFGAGASYRPSETYSPVYEAPNHNIISIPHSAATRRTYEDRLRDDHNALTDIRKRAAARGISWSFNMTFDDIHALIMEAEEREQQLQQRVQYQQKAMSPPQNVIDRAYGHSGSQPSPAPGGFGVLLPPRTSHRGRRATFGPLGPLKRKSSLAAPVVANGAAEVVPERLTPKTTHSNISFVEENTSPKPLGDRRPSSSTRPKSSRFRVDPRGLRGESPGPGTIINMYEKLEAAEHMRQAAERDNRGRALRGFEGYQKREEEERKEGWPRKAAESHGLNGHGHNRV
ncbi:hypothetical protein Z517_02118 [Fonsecaea pedrosoi CBS 271.37]|uniref:Uncharacterized protein n=1 Tax=Fonsecaea pedrosoi CBS 271.37 TaxID=1442368 RepID=A0A0D2GW79_9EURO|nr:uncharacterized protein Z517_02118 [Fonsecaea pedrosoi CBS 271.37]KIW82875.1 hypothetical protein Z517_02118 [Fonsecaea pedrosoi CBS 271.37]